MLPPVLAKSISNSFDKLIPYPTSHKLVSEAEMDFSQEELLIDEVRERKFLYDKSSKDYSDKQKKINAFEEIALVMGFTGIIIYIFYHKKLV